jgi:hypothetical protein
MVRWCMALWGRIAFWVYLFILVWADGTSNNPADPDLWHRLALGEFLERTGHFPVGDTFSYLADYQYIPDHEWGSAVIFYKVWRLTGGGAGFGTAMVGLKLALMAATLALVVWAGLRRNRPSVPLAAFYAVVLFAMLPSFLSTLRCMAFTHLLFALWLYWYQCERTGRRIPGWAYALTMLLWANLHGGFVIGLLWLALVAGIEAARGGPWLIWAGRLVACGLVTLVNPFGWNLWVVTLRALAVPRAGFAEWAAVPWLNWQSFFGYKVLLVVTVLALAYLAARRRDREIDYRAVALIDVFLLLSLFSARNTSLFALVAGALLPGTLPDSPRATRINSPPRRLVYMGICSACMLVPFYAALLELPGDGLRLIFHDATEPVEAMNFLKQSGVKGNLLTPFNPGSYAMWALRGQMRVSMDGRYDLVYKPETLVRVDAFYLAKPEGLSLLTDPRPDAILVPVDEPIYRPMRTNLAWREAFHGGGDAVFLPR